MLILVLSAPTNFQKRKRMRGIQWPVPESRQGGVQLVFLLGHVDNEVWEFVTFVFSIFSILVLFCCLYLFVWIYRVLPVAFSKGHFFHGMHIDRCKNAKRNKPIYFRQGSWTPKKVDRCWTVLMSWYCCASSLCGFTQSCLNAAFDNFRSCRSALKTRQGCKETSFRYRGACVVFFEKKK